MTISSYKKIISKNLEFVHDVLEALQCLYTKEETLSRGLAQNTPISQINYTYYI